MGDDGGGEGLGSGCRVIYLVRCMGIIGLRLDLGSRCNVRMRVRLRLSITVRHG